MVTRSPATYLFAPLRRMALANDAVGRTDGDLLTVFVESHNPTAFAELVRRHGPMVLGVCRRVIGDVHSAEDAFQAVFLVLARRANVVRPRGQVGNWLYGVAYRTALKAKALRAKRATRETSMESAPQPIAPTPAEIWSDLQPILDAELAKLPDKLRLPIVLCDLEGRSQREVAKQLGIAPATLAGRIGKARQLLAERLTERGITLSASGLALALAGQANATVPVVLADAVIEVAILAACGGPLVGSVPANVLQLTDGVLQMMLLTKLKAATVGVLTALVLATGFSAGTLSLVKADDAAKPKPVAAKPVLGPNLSDEEFLKRVCNDLRGTPPSVVETDYFVKDRDSTKRKKVVGWLTDDVSRAEGITDLATFFDGYAIDQNLARFDKRWVSRLQTKNEYRIEPPDILGIQSQTGIVGQTPKPRQFIVHPDGTINLQSFYPTGGVVNVNGLTVPEATKTVNEHLVKAGWPDGTVKVMVVAFNSKFAYIIADLALNGEQVIRFPITGNETVLDAISQISGLLKKGPMNVWVARRNQASGPDQILPVDWKGITEHGDTKTNYQILPGDRVYFKPESPTAPFLHHPTKDANCAVCHNLTPTMQPQARFWLEHVTPANADEAFLTQVIQHAYNRAPSRIEREYFLGDKDTRKKLNLGQLVLKDPTLETTASLAVQQILASLSRKEFADQIKLMYDFESVTAKRLQSVERVIRFVDSVVDGKRSDEQILELLTAMNLGRLPTESERKLILANVSQQADKKAAWREVVGMLRSTEEAKRHAAELCEKK